MPRVVFSLPDGSRRDVEGEEGLTAMHAALAAKVPGIEADCYGDCACATCHVYVDAAWGDRLAPPNVEERSMLAEAVARVYAAGSHPETEAQRDAVAALVGARP